MKKTPSYLFITVNQLESCVLTRDRIVMPLNESYMHVYIYYLRLMSIGKLSEVEESRGAQTFPICTRS